MIEIPSEEQCGTVWSSLAVHCSRYRKWKGAWLRAFAEDLVWLPAPPSACNCFTLQLYRLQPPQAQHVRRWCRSQVGAHKYINQVLRRWLKRMALGYLYVNLTQARIILEEEETSTKKMSPPDWDMGKPVIFPDWWFLWEGPARYGRYHPRVLEEGSWVLEEAEFFHGFWLRYCLQIFALSSSLTSSVMGMWAESYKMKLFSNCFWSHCFITAMGNITKTRVQQDCVLTKGYMDRSTSTEHHMKVRDWFHKLHNTKPSEC